jgi:hypothetical protein
MARRIMRSFLLKEISGVHKPAQAHARVAIMKRDFTPEESAAFNATGAGPTHDRLRRLYDNNLRARPNMLPEDAFAAAWRLLSPSDRNEIRAEESGEAQARATEEARLRASAKTKGLDMTKIDIGALTLFALECAAEVLRKRDPSLTQEQAFARAYSDPANREIAKMERAASAERLAGFPVARTEPAILNSMDDDEIERMLQDEIDRNPYLTNAALFRTVANSIEERTARAAYGERVRLATRDGERVPQPADVSTIKRDVALDGLNAKAAELRKSNPTLSEAQCFAKVFADPRYRDLARAERSASREAINA